MELVITNVSSSTVLLSDFYVSVAAAASITVTRSASDLPRLRDLQAKLSDGTVTVAVTPSAAELASGLLSAPQAVQAVDMAPVAAATVDSAEVTLRCPFVAAAAGTADDVTIYALNAFPYKVRVLWARAIVTTNIGGSTIDVRTQAAGAGTLLATIDTAVAGPVAAPSAAFTASTVVTPGATVGLFLRRSDRGVAGEIHLIVRRES